MDYGERYTAVLFRGKKHEAAIGDSIADVLSIERQCGGRGICGKCRVIARGELSPITDAERRMLSADELAIGVRLSCEARVLGPCSVCDLGGEAVGGDRIQLDSQIEPLPNSRLCGFGVAIDVGTTTVAAKLYSNGGELCGEAAALNPQIDFGADVVTRIELALNGKAAALGAAVSDVIDSLVLELSEKAGIRSDQISDAVIVGNTTMLYLLTRTSPLLLSRAPFALDRRFGGYFTSDELSIASLSSEARIYIPPCISAFVGADTVAALISCDLTRSRDAAMLVDIGTNSEMALWDGSKLAVASAAAGPAFEGVGISCGMRARSGAIYKAATDGDEIISLTVDGAEPIGICGSGLIDVAACLKELSLIDESGALAEAPIELARGVALTQEDIRMLQLAKGAIYGGMLALLRHSDAKMKKSPAVLIAGGFGCGVNIRNAKRISLIPSVFNGEISTIGNAALAGASKLLFDLDSRELAARIAAEAITVDLAQSDIFAECFVEGMRF